MPLVVGVGLDGPEVGRGQPCRPGPGRLEIELDRIGGGGDAPAERAGDITRLDHAQGRRGLAAVGPLGEGDRLAVAVGEEVVAEDLDPIARVGIHAAEAAVEAIPLPAPAAVPPMVLLLAVSMFFTPSPPLVRGFVPEASRPIELPWTRLPLAGPICPRA